MKQIVLLSIIAVAAFTACKKSKITSCYHCVTKFAVGGTTSYKVGIDTNICTTDTMVIFNYKDVHNYYGVEITTCN